MKENILLEKAKNFGVRIIKLARFLDDKKQKALANQVLRSGTSIGANISESEYAVSNADFINKLQIARKEANETKYWIELLKEAEIIDEKQFESLHNDVIELLKILGASVITAKKKSNFS